MNKSQNQNKSAHDNPLCAGFMKYLVGRPQGSQFKAQDWLETLDLNVLRHIETGTHCLVDDREPVRISRNEAQDLAGITVMLVNAESINQIKPSKIIECLDIYLAGLCCAACIERISRLGWVKRTARIGLNIEKRYPIEVTEKGRTEAVWSDERRVLAIMGLATREH